MPPLIFALIMLAGFGGLYMTQTVMSKPDFAHSLGAYSPWLGSHATLVGYVASGLMLSATILLPWILAHRDHDGRLEEMQETMLYGIAAIAKPILTVLWIASIGYIFGVGFFAAKHAGF